MQARIFVGLFAVTATMICGAVRAAAPAACDISHAAETEHDMQAGHSAAVAEMSKRTNSDFQSLMKSRSWQDGIPVRDQMTAAEVEKLGGLQAQMKVNLIAALYESKRERDIRVISRMATLADQSARTGLPLPADTESEDHFLMTLLAGMESSISRPDLVDAVAVTSGCTLEHALWDAALTAASEGAAMPELRQIASTTASLSAKYGSPIPEPENLAPADRDAVHQMLPALRKVQATRTLTESLMKLALMESTSKAMLQAWHLDQYEMPGDLAYTGTTWERWMKEGRVTASQHQMTRVINAINQRIPPQVFEDKRQERAE